MDPLDRANLRIGKSQIDEVNGDALIARRDIAPMENVAYYTGVLVEDTEVSFDMLPDLGPGNKIKGLRQTFSHIKNS